MDANEIIERIEKLVAEAGSQKALADKWGISPQYLCDVLAGRRDPGNSIVKHLGLKRVVAWKARLDAPDR